MQAGKWDQGAAGLGGGKPIPPLIHQVRFTICGGLEGLIWVNGFFAEMEGRVYGSPFFLFSLVNEEGGVWDGYTLEDVSQVEGGEGI